MDKYFKNLHGKNSVRSRVRELFGMNDDQLVRELEKAQEENKRAEELQPPPEEFEHIIAEMNRRGGGTRVEKEIKAIAWGGMKNGRMERRGFAGISKCMFVVVLVIIVTAVTLAAVAAESVDSLLSWTQISLHISMNTMTSR